MQKKLMLTNFGNQQLLKAIEEYELCADIKKILDKKSKKTSGDVPVFDQ